MLNTLANFIFKRYDGSSNALGQPPDTMASGSSNVMVAGTGKNFIFRGIKSLGGATGSQVMMNVAEDYAGLGSAAETGIGSVFRVLGAWFYIGAGLLYRNGTSTGDSASTTLSLKKVTSGVLGVVYQVGLAQPSAPTITAVAAPSGFTGKNNGVVSVKIARVRASTGARSNASLSSNVVTATNHSIAVTFPSADVNGQDYWEVDVTKNGEGAVGNHFFLQEIPEAIIASISATGTLDSDTTIGVPNGTLTTANHVGAVAKSLQIETQIVAGTITTAGNAKCVVTAVGMTGSPVTVTYAVLLGDTASDVAGKARTALAANTNVGAFFTIGGTTTTITHTTKTYAVNDATMNFTVEDDTSVGITDNLTSTNTACGMLTTVTAVGANDSHSAGKQTITLAVAAALTSTQTLRFTREQNAVERTYVVEWRDADIVGSDLAPIREYPPPAGIFGGSSGDVVFVDGAYGDTVDVTEYAVKTGLTRANTTISTLGNAIAVSDPSKPESFPPDNYIFTGDSPTAVLAGGSGIHWRFSQNSLGVIRYVGGSPAVSYERMWTGIGVKNQKHCVLGSGGRLYAYTGQKGLVRLGTNGEPDTLFATPVHDDIASWTAANVWMGYDANQQYVLIGHSTTVLAFYEPLDDWCTPLSISGYIGGSEVVKSAVTVSGNCYLSVGSAGLSVYNFNEPATGGATLGTVFTPWIESQQVFDTLARLHVALRLDTTTTVTIETFVNGSSTASSSQAVSVAGSAGRLVHVPVLRPNVRSAKAFRLKVSFSTESGNLCGFETVRVEGMSQNITF